MERNNSLKSGVPLLDHINHGIYSLMHCLLVFFPCVCLLSIVFFLLCTQFSEAGTKGDGGGWNVPDAQTAVSE